MTEAVNVDAPAAPSPAQANAWRRLWDVLLLETPEPTPTDSRDADADERAN